MSQQIKSNIYIDTFIEKLSNLGVNQNDILNYQDYSLQFELIENLDEKVSLLDNLILNFNISYPHLSQTLEEEINQLYFDVCTFGNIDYNNNSEMCNKVISDLFEKFRYSDYQGTFYDLGNDIGLILGRYFNNKKLGIRELDFLEGLNHGIKIYRDAVNETNDKWQNSETN